MSEARKVGDNYLPIGYVLTPYGEKIEREMCEYFGFPSPPTKTEGLVMEAIWHKLSLLWPNPYTSPVARHAEGQAVPQPAMSLYLISETIHSMDLHSLIMKRLKEISESAPQPTTETQGMTAEIAQAEKCPTCDKSDKYVRHPGTCSNPFHDDFLRKPSTVDTQAPSVAPVAPVDPAREASELKDFLLRQSSSIHAEKALSDYLDQATAELRKENARLEKIASTIHCYWCGESYSKVNGKVSEAIALHLHKCPDHPSISISRLVLDGAAYRNRIKILESEVARLTAELSALRESHGKLERAVEHGKYLADSAEQYLAAKNLHDKREAEGSDPDPSELTDFVHGLRDGIYEFRKRATASERISPAQGLANEPRPLEQVLVHYDLPINAALWGYPQMLMTFCELIIGIPRQMAGQGTQHDVDTLGGQQSSAQGRKS